MYIIGYVRTGSKEQSEIEQLELLKAKASERGFELNDIYIDRGFSVNHERPEFEKVVSKVAQGDVLLLTLSADRLYRNVKDVAEFISFIKESGSRLICFEGDIDSYGYSAQIKKYLNRVTKY